MDGVKFLNQRGGATTERLPAIERSRNYPLGGRGSKLAFAKKNEGAGARTLDLRIKSPLLYRLSYTLGKKYKPLPSTATILSEQ